MRRDNISQKSTEFGALWHSVNFLG